MIEMDLEESGGWRIADPGIFKVCRIADLPKLTTCILNADYDKIPTVTTA